MTEAIACDPDLAEDASCGPWNESAKALVVRSMQKYADLVALVRACNDAGVPVAVLKGPAIAQTVYPDPSLRPFRDIDVLVHEADLTRTIDLLKGLEFQEREDSTERARIHPGHGLFQRMFVNPDTSRKVELHCDHLQLGLEPIGMEDIWNRAVELPFGDSVGLALAPSDLLLHLCVHLHRHGFERLIWYKDIDLLVRSGTVDWDHVRWEARQQGCVDSIAYSLHLLRRMLATPLPAEARALMGQSMVSHFLMRLAWPPKKVLRLEPQRPLRWRRAVQFAPETGLLRGGLPSLMFNGRRADKARVLGAAWRP